MTTNVALFVLAAVFEIAGCFAFWVWVRRGAVSWVVVVGIASLVGFALALTRVDSAFAGRAYAAYGGIYIATSLAWLWVVERQVPTRADVLGDRLETLKNSAMERERRQSITRFGDFEFDPAAGDLRRRGRRITIQEQPLKLLEMLVARAGQLVNRQELCHRLWPEAFVDFDNGLNNAVSRLRTALGDSAATPRFIETMGRRGYRFIGAIQLGREGSGPPPVRAWLIGHGERVALKAGENVLGRRAPDVVDLPSPTVSRRHARITVGDETLIEDLGSKNGTFVEEQRVSRPVTLTDGAHVRIGALTLRFMVVSNSEETRTDTGE